MSGQDTAGQATPPVVLVRTLSGSGYRIDLGLMLMTRMPAENTDKSRDPELPESVPLRRDQRSLKILRIHRLEVGARAVFDVEPLGNPRLVSFTRRTTTVVLSIEEIDLSRSDDEDPRPGP